MFTHTMESISNIVAPVPEEDLANQEDSDIGDETEDDDNTSFEDRMQSFISSKRNETLIESHTTDPPESPNSFIDVDLGDDTPNAQTRDTFQSKPSLHKPVSLTSGTSFLSNNELEKKVQVKHRDSLEGEISSFEDRQRDVEIDWTQRLNVVQLECDRWKALTTTLQSDLDLAQSNGQNQYEHVCHTCAHHERRLKDTSAALEESTEENDRLILQLTSQSEQLEQIQTELYAAIEEQQRLRQVSDESLSGLNRLQIEFVAMEQERDHMRSELMLTRQRLDAHIHAKHTDAAATSERNDDLLTANLQLSADVSSLETELSSTASSLLAAHEQIQTLGAQLSVAISEADKRKHEITSDASTAMSRELAVLGGELSVAREALVTAEKHRDDSLVTIASLHHELDATNKEKFHLEAASKESRQLTEQQRGIITALQTELAASSERLMAEQIASAESIQQYSSDAVALQQHVLSMQSECQRLTEALSRSEAGKDNSVANHEMELRIALEQTQPHSKSQVGSPVALTAVQDDDALSEVCASQHSALCLLQSLVYTYSGEAVPAEAGDRPAVVDPSAPVLERLRDQTALLGSRLDALSTAMRMGFESSERIHVALTEAATCVLRCEMGTSSSKSSGRSSRRLSGSDRNVFGGGSVAQDNVQRAEVTLFVSC